MMHAETSIDSSSSSHFSILAFFGKGKSVISSFVLLLAFSEDFLNHFNKLCVPLGGILSNSVSLPCYDEHTYTHTAE